MVTSRPLTRGSPPPLSAPLPLSMPPPRRRPPNCASAGVAAAATSKPNAARLFITDRQLQRLRALLGREEGEDAAHRVHAHFGDLGERLRLGREGLASLVAVEVDGDGEVLELFVRAPRGLQALADDGCQPVEEREH